MEAASLMDLGFTGSGYTWKRSNVAARLDSVLMNRYWCHSFTEASMIHLPNLKSDHTPLWLRTFRMEGWKLITQKDTLWSRVLRAKYKCGSDLIPQIRTHRGANTSRLWKGFVNNWKHVLDGIEWRLGDGKKARIVKDAFVSKSKKSNVRMNRSIVWDKPPARWVKLNVDGSVISKPDTISSCGGIIRNEEGHFVGGFTRNLGDCSITQAELWGIYSGLELWWNLGVKKVKVETYSSATNELAMTIGNSTHSVILLLA
ncbi:heat shock 70 kDa protein-like [Senna tora]|uniref:Heat shock 70 kDa protein-like n=1 Tax=Senna tora TaxID=362788 RepID=A0A834TLI0_9FABA|nr:heat shock 70 kDa protein-like [Senna tora]